MSLTSSTKTAAVDPPKTIFEAAERGLTGYITRTIERAIEFNVNIRDKYQRTALHWAAEAGQVEAVECLMDYGVDPVATECNGRTAIHLAARSGHSEVLRVLLDTRPPAEQEQLVNQPDFFGLTPVFLALQRLAGSLVPTVRSRTPLTAPSRRLPNKVSAGGGGNGSTCYGRSRGRGTCCYKSRSRNIRCGRKGGDVIRWCSGNSSGSNGCNRGRSSRDREQAEQWQQERAAAGCRSSCRRGWWGWWGLGRRRMSSRRRRKRRGAPWWRLAAVQQFWGRLQDGRHAMLLCRGCGCRRAVDVWRWRRTGAVDGLCSGVALLLEGCWCSLSL
ncbi:hypothetical protein Agub_g2900 [Astrephomene gubernaculifera]|uniref:Uncharacterized protein n=1 Tax=Astrephomene gubernaculifera TaxID=47775 RepID=A0AAD3DJV3_9CHLO|nr:hypothetical protein Agub_g2900 [Astrephomene gubernaculifera]